MVRFKCDDCGLRRRDVRLVEHGIDDMSLCKSCFEEMRAEVQGEGDEDV